MEDELELPENKLRDFIQHTDKGKWRCENNHNIRYFTEDEIKCITSSYSTKIGSGAFGEVYKGVLRDGQSVAVKRNIRMNTEEEFAKEVISHSQINHKNVVRLIGCCVEKNAQMMVFEHVTNGNLNDYLHCGDAIISLDTRLSIAIDCAEALWCMHSMYRPVLHGDIKPSNILLDDNFRPKISDFGLARLLSGGNNDWTMNVKGSIGYMDPTFMKEGRLTPRIDVYSFGVVLVELITKTKPTDNAKKIVERFARFSTKQKAIRELFDANIANAGSIKVLEGIGKIAKECLKEKIDERPEMNVVSRRLWELKITLEQAKDNAGRRRLFSEGQSVLKRKDQRETILYKIKSGLGIINRETRDFMKIRDKILQNINNNMMIFTYKELKNITQNFSTVLGRGAYAKVYFGTLVDNTSVSVKQIFTVTYDDAVADEFIIHAQMHHSNITKFVGCCLQDYFGVFLVHEYVPNGSLDLYLFKSVGVEKDGDSTADQPVDGRQLLDLNTRHQIALGIARAMTYMHEERQDWVLHCDIKPENILLDSHFSPKVCDFGLSKMRKRGEVTVSNIHEVPDFELSQNTSKPDERMTMSRIRGTRGYMAPEWVIHREPITVKADVYSFGMVLLEIVSGRRNLGFRQESIGSEDWYFPRWAYEKMYVERRIDDILDPRIAESYGSDAVSVASIDRMVKTAMWCLQDRAEMRPSMGKVTKMLEGSVEITEPVEPTIFCVQDDHDDDESIRSSV